VRRDAGQARGTDDGARHRPRRAGARAASHRLQGSRASRCTAGARARRDDARRQTKAAVRDDVALLTRPAVSVFARRRRDEAPGRRRDDRRRRRETRLGRRETPGAAVRHERRTSGGCRWGCRRGCRRFGRRRPAARTPRGCLGRLFARRNRRGDAKRRDDRPGVRASRYVRYVVLPRGRRVGDDDDEEDDDDAAARTTPGISRRRRQSRSRSRR